MSRVAGIAAAFVATLGVAAWLTVALLGPAAEARGRNIYRYRERLDVTTRPLAHPLVVWLGDSTMMDMGFASYPSLLRPRLRTLGITSLTLAELAFDFAAYYLVMDPIIAMRPELVVIPAHLALFYEQLRRLTYQDLASLLPAAELPQAMALPLQARDLSPARLLLARLLRVPVAERIFYGAEGLRAIVQHLPAWRALGPVVPVGRSEGDLVELLSRSKREALEHYALPLGRRNAILRTMAATLRMASARGVQVLVVGVPIPYEAMRGIGVWDAAKDAKRFALLRAVVEENGGRFLDLHTALGGGGFRDWSGHYNAAGAAQLATLLEPRITELVAAPVVRR